MSGSNSVALISEFQLLGYEKSGLVETGDHSVTRILNPIWKQAKNNHCHLWQNAHLKFTHQNLPNLPILDAIL